MSTPRNENITTHTTSDRDGKRGALQDLPQAPLPIAAAYFKEQRLKQMFNIFTDR